MSLSSPAPVPQKSSNPRRTPSHLSVSLIHGRRSTGPQIASSSLGFKGEEDKRKKKKKKKKNNEKENVNNDDDVAVRGSVKPKYERNHSSGESSNVENWFESSNNNVQAANPDIMEGNLPDPHSRRE